MLVQELRLLRLLVRLLLEQKVLWHLLHRHAHM
jgi:hypothetical protein